jgi:hypothetical protein
MPRSLTVLVLFAGCGDDGVVPAIPDAPPVSADASLYDFGCLGTSSPTTAPDPASISGFIRNLTDTQPVAGITVELHRVSNDAIVGSSVTTGTGMYESSIVTGGAAFDVYSELTGTGFVPRRVYFSAILSANSAGSTLSISTPSEDAAVGAAFGITTDPQRGAVAVLIEDCAGARVTGAQISVSPTPTFIGYFNDAGVPDQARTSTGALGIALAANVPPGAVTVTVTYGTTTWRARPIVVEAGVTTVSFRRP